MWYIYTVEYYSATKKNEMVPFAATRAELETITLGEFRQRQISRDITYMQNLKRYKGTYVPNRNRVTDRAKKTLWLLKGGGMGRDLGLTDTHYCM